MAPLLKIKKILKRKTAQMFELKHALAYAKGIVDTIREPLVVLYPKLTISSVNKAFYNTFKTDVKETVGKHIYDLGNGQWDIPLLKKLLEKILVRRSSFNDFEVENNFETIGHKVMLLNARKLKIAGKGEQMILLAIEDITDRRLLEGKVQDEKNLVAENRHLLALATQRVDFVNVASHELKTPITCIKGYNQVLQMEFEAEGNTHAAGMLTKMNTQIDKLTNLLENLLNSVRVEDGKLLHNEALLLNTT